MSLVLIASNFSNIFGVSIGVHLAYGLLNELHASPINRLKDFLDNYKQTAARLKDEYSFGLNQALRLVELTMALNMIQLKRNVDKCAKVSVIFAVYSLICLILVSFFPGYELNLISAIILASFAILPMPILALIVYFITKRGLLELEEPLKIANKEFRRVIGDSRNFNS